MARDPVNLHLVSPMPSRNKSFFNDPRSRTKITDHKIITILTPAEAVPQSGCGRAQCAGVKRVSYATSQQVLHDLLHDLRSRAKNTDYKMITTLTPAGAVLHQKYTVT